MASPSSMSHIDPSEILPEDIIQSVIQRPDNPLLSGPLSQPEPDPSVALDIDNSTVIDTVRGLLTNDFTESRAAWLHPSASILTDITNGVRHTQIHNPLNKFRDLPLNEQFSLNSLNITLTTLQDFFSECQGDADDWSLCYRWMTECLLPCTAKDWDSHLITCSQNIQVARETTVNEGVRRTNAEIDDWLATRRFIAQDAVINRLVSEHAPSFDHLLSDPRVIEWATRLHQAMVLHFEQRSLDDASVILAPTIATHIDSYRDSLIEEARNGAKEDACHHFDATLKAFQGPV